MQSDRSDWNEPSKVDGKGTKQAVAIVYSKAKKK